MSESALLRVDGLVKHFPTRKGVVRAVDGVSFSLGSGETLALVGESGSGKTTIGRLILRLIEPTAGEIIFRGTDLMRADRKQLRSLRSQMQIIFQDPYSSLNPHMTVGKGIAEPLVIHGMGSKAERKQRVGELLDRVGLSRSEAQRLPRDLSGGQRQRVAIARALALQPMVLICDEPVSALDVSIQAQILNLLADLQEDIGLAYLFISHDLSVVREVADRVAVMYLGMIVELAPCDTIFSSPGHPYTVALLSAAPQLDPEHEQRRERLVLTGELPSPVDPPSGCRFRTRCWRVCDLAETHTPLVELRPDHFVACHYPQKVSGQLNGVLGQPTSGLS